jgi:hypothetical protein
VDGEFYAADGAVSAAMRTDVSKGSSAIVRLSYDDETSELFITFKDGRSYVIPDFPEIEFERWSNSVSLGGYFNSFVRGNY